MKRRVILILFVLLILGASAFLLYQFRFRESRVDLKIEASEEAASGEEIEYKVVIENNNNFDLKNVLLSFSYPEGSLGLDQDGKPLDSLLNNLDIGGISGRDKKELVLKAVLAGEKGEIKKAGAAVSYSPSNLNSVFRKNAEAATVISKISIPLTLSGPPNILSGQKIQVSLDLRNETENDFSDLQVSFSYPDGFVFERGAPFPSEGNNIFNISSLKAGEGARISIEGRISGFEKEAKRFIAVLRRKAGGEFFDFQKSQVVSTVSVPLLTTEVLLNDSKDYIAKAGDRLKYRVKFANNSNNNFSALELAVKLEGQMFDFATLKTSGFFDQSSRTILWNAAALSLLSSLAPNQSGEISFDIGLKNDFPKTFAKNYSLKASSLIQTSSVPPDFDLEKISAVADLVTKIKSMGGFTATALYGDSVFPNSGPNPPVVGQKTTYTIHWKIVNEGNDLINARIVSSLLPGVSWEDKVKTIPSQSGLDYNLSTGQVSWEIPTVPAGTGAVSPVFEAVFQVGVTPSVNQGGQEIDIMKESVLEAVDNFTRENVSLSQPGLSAPTGAYSY